MKYEEIIEKVESGVRCSVDFKNRVVKLDGKAVELEPESVEIIENLDDWLTKVEDLYDDYKYSRPTKSSNNKARFKALSVSQLIEECGHDALSNPIGRDVALARLEVFIVLSLLNGSFNPDELFTKDWFFQGADKSLIIRKDWF